MPEGALWNPDVQTMPRERLLALQEERLREAVARAAERPFWRRRLDEAGLSPDDVKTVADLPRVPRTVKDDLRRSQAEHPPYGDYQATDGAIRVGTTTGTTGAPTLIVWTARDLAVEHEAAARMWWRFGVRPGMTVAHSHPLGIYGGGAILSSALEAFGALTVAVGAPATPEQAEQAIRLFQLVRPQMYMMFDAATVSFLEAAKRLGVDPKEINLRIRAPHPAQATSSASAGNECFSFLGGACKRFDGAHLCEDLAVVECVDAGTGEPVPDGERGRLVVTTLARDNVMLRYDLEDVVRLDRSVCACGETSARMWWLGRAKDIVRVAGREVLPSDVWWVLEDWPELKAPSMEYQIVRRGAEQDALEVRVEGDAPALGGEIGERMTERLGVPARVEVVPRGALPRFDYKASRVLDV